MRGVIVVCTISGTYAYADARGLRVPTFFSSHPGPFPTPCRWRASGVGIDDQTLPATARPRPKRRICAVGAGIIVMRRVLMVMGSVYSGGVLVKILTGRRAVRVVLVRS